MRNPNKSHSKFAKITFVVKNIFFILLSVPLIIFLIAWLVKFGFPLLMFVPYLRYLVYIIILIYIISLLSALKKRRKFLKGLKKLVSDQKCSVSEIKHPYSSVFFRTSGESFILDVKGTQYSCKLLSFTNRLLPVVFGEDGFYYRISARKLKLKLSPTMQFQHIFDYESKLPKIIILTSVPYVVMINHKNRMFLIDTGDVCGKFKIFNRHGFLGAIERDCINFKRCD